MAGSNNNNPWYTRDFEEVLKAESEYIAQRRADIKLTEDELKKFGERVSKLKNSDSENKWKFGNGKIGLAFSGRWHVQQHSTLACFRRLPG